MTKGFRGDDPDRLIAELMPPSGFDIVLKIMKDVEAGVPLDDSSLPVVVRPYYDADFKGLRNELDGRGIGYTSGLATVDGITMLPRMTFANVVQGHALEKERFKSERLDMAVDTESLAVLGHLLLRTELPSNPHKIKPLGDKARCYMIEVAKLPKRYGAVEGNKILFNFWALLPHMMVDLVNHPYGQLFHR